MHFTFIISNNCNISTTVVIQSRTLHNNRRSSNIRRIILTLCRNHGCNPPSSTINTINFSVESHSRHLLSLHKVSAHITHGECTTTVQSATMAVQEPCSRRIIRDDIGVGNKPISSIASPHNKRPATIIRTKPPILRVTISTKASLSSERLRISFCALTILHTG